MIAAIIQENALLAILRINTRLHVVVEPGIQAGTRDTEICVSLYSHRPREVAHEVGRLTSRIRSKVRVTIEESNRFGERPRRSGLFSVLEVR
jgi:hypothetical protein